MQKRKRNEAEDGGDVEIEDQALRIRVSRLKAKVEQGYKNIATALKLARGFERQKLGRRTKAAQQKPTELLRLKEEVIVLKSMNLDSTARNYLDKQLAKTKRIKESPAYAKMYGKGLDIEGPKPGAAANVMARLFNSNPVRDGMPEVMRGIYSCLGIEEKRPRVIHTPQEQKAMDLHGETSIEKAFEGFSEDSSHSESRSRSKGSSRSGQGSNSEDEGLAEYNDRLGSSTGEDDEEVGKSSWSEFSQLQSNGQNHDRKRSGRPLRPSSLSISDSETSQSPPPKQRKVKASLQKSASTSFLPSLSLGGYYSGSDSDDDEQGDRRHNDGPPLPQTRNNRRGQRARQKIAEKKFGKNAKHLAKQSNQTAKGRDAGWDAKRGATDVSRKRDRFGRIGSRLRLQAPSGANADAVKERTGKDKVDGPLHPSWEAAKKRKEEQKPLLAFAGKKTTFD